MGKQNSIEKITPFLIPAALLALYKKHQDEIGYFPTLVSDEEAEVYQRFVKSAKLTDFGPLTGVVKLLTQKSPSLAVKILDGFDVSLAYQYAERNREIYKAVENVMSQTGKLDLVNLGCGYDLRANVFANDNKDNVYLYNVDKMETIQKRDRIINNMLYANGDGVEDPLWDVLTNYKKDNDCTDLTRPQSVDHLFQKLYQGTIYGNDAPKLFIAKGLFMYMDRDDTTNVLRKISRMEQPAIIGLTHLDTLGRENETELRESTKENMHYKDAMDKNMSSQIAASVGLELMSFQKPSEWMSGTISYQAKKDRQEYADKLDNNPSRENIIFLRNNAATKAGITIS